MVVPYSEESGGGGGQHQRGRGTSWHSNGLRLNYASAAGGRSRRGSGRRTNQGTAIVLTLKSMVSILPRASPHTKRLGCGFLYGTNDKFRHRRSPTTRGIHRFWLLVYVKRVNYTIGLVHIYWLSRV